jgi:hypothetical protein
MEEILQKTEITKQIDVLKNLLELESFEDGKGELLAGYKYYWDEEEGNIIKNKILELVNKL